MRKDAAGTSGYKLVELMIVVLIIGIASAIAAPAIMESRKNTILGEAARETYSIFETARARSLMRNAAMRVVITKGSVSAPGSIWLHESTSTSCNNFPPDQSSDPVRWGILHLDLSTSHWTRFHIHMSDLRVGTVRYLADGSRQASGSSVASLDLCLNRRGTVLVNNGGTFSNPSWIRLNNGGSLSNNQVTIGFQRQDEGANVGVEKLVVLKQGAVARIMR